jgi:putative acetyltransferase
MEHPGGAAKVPKRYNEERILALVLKALALAKGVASSVVGGSAVAAAGSAGAGVPSPEQREGPLRITRGSVTDPRVRALLEYHAATARMATAPGSAHALDIEALGRPDIRLWAAWKSDTLAGVGALKSLTDEHGEIKSMHTAEAFRRSGVGRAILAHIVEEARVLGMLRVSLETGSWDYFEPARSLYRSYGFRECLPFGEYVDDPSSVFMTLDIG